MLRRRSRSIVIKLFAAAAVATASAPAPELPLAFCEDIEVIDTKVLTKPPKRGDEPLPELLENFLDTYAREHPDTYAGTWLSGAVSRKWSGGTWVGTSWGGTFVLAFTDDPKPHLEAIRRRRPPETGDWPVDVVRAPHTESELVAVRRSLFEMFAVPTPYDKDKLTRNEAKLAYYEAKLRACQPDDVAKYQAKVDKYRGAERDPLRQLRTKFVGFSARLDSQLSRVRIIFSLPGLLSPPEPTVEDVAAMAEALPDDIHGKVCVQGRRWLDDRLQARFAPMADAGADPLVDCDGSPLAPWSTFTSKPDVPVGSNDPLHVLLHGLGPAEGWRTLVRDGKRATFYWTDGNRYKVRPYKKTWTGWRMARETSGVGECGLEVTRLALPVGLGTVQMRLDRQNPPDPESTTLHLLVSQEDCASGMSGVELMLKPEVIESATEIRVAMGVIKGGGGTCPSNRFDPITIELAAPIGGRKIFDGLFLLPRPLRLPEMPPRLCTRAAEGVEEARFRAGRRVVIATEAPGGRPTTREEYEAWFEQVESLVDARCTGCACCSWDGENYSECRPSTEAYPCDQPTEYCVWCEDDGETPMPGRWTTHARQCEMYEGLRDGRRDNSITKRAKTLAILKDFYGRANPDKVVDFLGRSVANPGAIATEYEGFEELLYDRLERQYKYVPGGPFKVWRTGPPFPAPEAPEPAAIDESPDL